MEEGPAVGHLVLLVVPGGPGLHVAPRAAVLVLQQDAVRPGQLGGGAGAGGGDGGVEDAEEPDHQAHDVLRVEPGVVAGLGLWARGGGEGATGGVVELRLAVLVLGAVDGRPGEVHDVQRDHGALQQTGLGHVLLHLREDRGDGQRQADQQVEGDEELVELALAGPLPGVVEEHQDDGGDGPGVHEAGAGEQGSQPTLALVLHVVAVPGLRPTENIS